MRTTDMRKGFDGLCGLVTGQLKSDPLLGALFLFVNRRRDRMKVLYWDGDGLAIWYRRLEQGSFRQPNLIALLERRIKRLLIGIERQAQWRRTVCMAEGCLYTTTVVSQR